MLPCRGVPGSCAAVSRKPSDGCQRRAQAYTTATLARWTRWLIALAVCFIAAQARAELRIELITVEPGEALYERFGHTALRVYDGGGEFDRVYSFGAAPFFDPHFLWQFARGDGEFHVVAESYATTLARYRRADRTLMRQRLLLPQARSAELALRLQFAAQPPNDRYLYDQLYDNCATRVRDLIDRVSDGALTRAASKRHPDHSYRDDTLAAMAGHPVGHWALDLIGGRHQDLGVSSYHEMYLPVRLRDRLAEASIVHAGRETPLAAAPELVFVRRGPPLGQHVQRARWVMLSLALLLGSLALALRRSGSLHKRRLSAFALCLLALWSGLFGLLVVPLTAFSHVHNFSPNENAYLFWPTDLLLMPALYRCVSRGVAVGRLLSVYVLLKLLVFGALVLLKLVGVASQHNVVFVCIAAAFALPLGALTGLTPGWLASRLRAKRSRA